MTKFNNQTFSVAQGRYCAGCDQRDVWLLQGDALVVKLTTALNEIRHYAGPISQSFCEDLEQIRKIANEALQ